MVHLMQAGATVSTLNQSCVNRGGAPDCVALYERRIALYEGALGPNHPAVGGLLGELSYFLYFAASQERLKARNAGGEPRADPRFEKAIAYRRRELSIYTQAFGTDDLSLVQPARALADIYQSIDDASTAHSLSDRALKMENTVRPARSEEALVKHEVRQLRLLLHFDEADDKIELYKTHHPESTLRLE